MSDAPMTDRRSDRSRGGARAAFPHGITRLRARKPESCPHPSELSAQNAISALDAAIRKRQTPKRESPNVFVAAGARLARDRIARDALLLRWRRERLPRSEHWRSRRRERRNE